MNIKYDLQNVNRKEIVSTIKVPRLFYTILFTALFFVIPSHIGIPTRAQINEADDRPDFILTTRVDNVSAQNVKINKPDIYRFFENKIPMEKIMILDNFDYPWIRDLFIFTKDPVDGSLVVTCYNGNSRNMLNKIYTTSQGGKLRGSVQSYCRQLEDIGIKVVWTDAFLEGGNYVFGKGPQGKNIIMLYHNVYIQNKLIMTYVNGSLTDEMINSFDKDFLVEYIDKKISDEDVENYIIKEVFLNNDAWVIKIDSIPNNYHLDTALNFANNFILSRRQGIDLVSLNNLIELLNKILISQRNFDIIVRDLSLSIESFEEIDVALGTLTENSQQNNDWKNAIEQNTGKEVIETQSNLGKYIIKNKPEIIEIIANNYPLLYNILNSELLIPNYQKIDLSDGSNVVLLTLEVPEWDEFEKAINGNNEVDILFQDAFKSWIIDNEKMFQSIFGSDTYIQLNINYRIFDGGARCAIVVLPEEYN